VSADPLGQDWHAWPTLLPEVREKVRTSLRERAMKPRAPDIPLLRLTEHPEGLEAAQVRLRLLMLLEATRPEGRRCGIQFRPARDR
jgi:hypothetical protein